ncbi:hypothetical protein DXA89_11540 [Weissella cibaria]|nr:hypothetical protein DXA89_11540 [Weissella cibaria]
MRLSGSSRSFMGSSCVSLRVWAAPMVLFVWDRNLKIRGARERILRPYYDLIIQIFDATNPFYSRRLWRWLLTQLLLAVIQFPKPILFVAPLPIAAAS